MEDLAYASGWYFMRNIHKNHTKPKRDRGFCDRLGKAGRGTVLNPRLGAENIALFFYDKRRLLIRGGTVQSNGV
jgi:hypothetical protein